MQSHSTLGMNSDIILNVITLPDPLGGTAGSKLNPKKFYRLEHYLGRKQGILDPTDFQTEENICLPLCIAFHLATQNRPNHLRKLKKKIKEQKQLPGSFNSTIQTIYAVLNLDLNSKIELSMATFEKIQEWLGQKFRLRLSVYKLYNDKMETGIIYPGSSDYVSALSLLIYQSHCYLITSENTFFGKKKKRFCCHCRQIHRLGELCNIRCRHCLSQTCANLHPYPDVLRMMECKECGRFFKNTYCFELGFLCVDMSVTLSFICCRMHLMQKVCEEIARCPECGKTMARSKLEGHACLLHKCRNCSMLVEAGWS